MFLWLPLLKALGFYFVITITLPALGKLSAQVDGATPSKPSRIIDKWGSEPGDPVVGAPLGKPNNKMPNMWHLTF